MPELHRAWPYRSPSDARLRRDAQLPRDGELPGLRGDYAMKRDATQPHARVCLKAVEVFVRALLWKRTVRAPSPLFDDELHEPRVDLHDRGANFSRPDGHHGVMLSGF